MPGCFCVPGAGAKCSSARAVIGASSTAGRVAAASLGVNRAARRDVGISHRAAAKAASRAPGNDDRLDRVDLEAFRIDEPEAPNHPPGRPSTSVFGKIFLPSAFAHPRAGSESHHLST